MAATCGECDGCRAGHEQRCVLLLGAWWSPVKLGAELASRPDIAATLITHRFPLDDAAEAFRVAGDRASGAIKVVIHP